jgi:hypothetical protein
MDCSANEHVTETLDMFEEFHMSCVIKCFRVYDVEINRPISEDMIIEGSLS